MQIIPDEYVQELLDEIEESAAEFAVAKGQTVGLKEGRKIMKAQLMGVAEANGVKSVSKQEQFAYSHPTYRAAVDRLVEAIEREANLEYRCKIVEMKWESWRTLNANARRALPA